MKSLIKKWIRAGFCLVIAALTWGVAIHFVFEPRMSDIVAKDGGVPPMARELARRQVAVWTDPVLLKNQLEKMTRINAEWDFMGRTYLVLALANLSLRDPSTREENLRVMDRLIDQTVELEKSQGMYHFLMSYAKYKPFVEQPPRSLFIDGEIAMMMAARRMVEEKLEYREPMWERINASIARVQKSGVMLAESYPDECWVFDHANLLATIKMGDALDHEDHAEFCAKWIVTVRRNLVDRRTEMLVSYSTVNGIIGDGPEGSSIWMSAASLDLVDHSFAANQYAMSSRELYRGTLGFTWAAEWPRSWKGTDDVDSGPVIPLADLSTGSTGMAILAAGAFKDDEKLSGLITTLNFGGFPTRDSTGLHFEASNQVGDSVLLYALVQGPLWEKVRGKLRVK